MKSVLSQDGHGPALPDHRHGPMAARGPAHVRRSLGERLRLGEGAFTMVEIIAVIAIIALLAAAVTGGVIIATKKAAVKATTGLFQRLDLAIGMYHEDYGDYPPDRRPSGGWSGDWLFDDLDNRNNLNQPAETLWFFLGGMFEVTERYFYQDPSQGNNQPVLDDDELILLPRKNAYLSFKQKDLRRKGIEFFMDSSLRNENDPDSPEDGFPEIVDLWGNPIYYVAADRLSGTPDPPNDPKVNTDYDLISRGPDRLTGKADEYDERNPEVDGKYPNRDNIANFKMKD